MMWMKRPEFDRECTFYTDADVRGGLSWKDFCDLTLPIPSIEKQREIVADYQAVENKIKTNEAICEKLEETAQTIYRRWFEEFEFPDENRNPYKSNGGRMAWNEEYFNDLPIGWNVSRLEKLANFKYGKMLNPELFQEKGFPVFSGYGIRGYFTEYMYEEPQILVLCRGVSGTGEVKMSPPFSYITNLSIIVENDENEIGKQFLFYFLNNSDLKSLDSGSAQSMITIRDLSRFYIVIPENRIQKMFG